VGRLEVDVGRRVNDADKAFVVGATLIIIGLGVIWWPLALIAGGLVSLVSSIAMARADDGRE
jgi:multisubunit Na+/H+ antiporter MnhG subunit